MEPVMSYKYQNGHLRSATGFTDPHGWMVPAPHPHSPVVNDPGITPDLSYYSKPTDVSQQHHYARFKIQPITFISENNLPFWAGNVIKYVCRHDAKDGLKDLKKARDYLDKEIKRQEGVKDWWN